MIKQLRPFYTDEQLKAVYHSQYNHEMWTDHVERIEFTADVLAAMKPTSVADLSCGDGAIVVKSGVKCPAILGDLMGVPMEVSLGLASGMDISGPIEQTICEIGPVDVFVLSETLEHVQRPGVLLRAIRQKAKRLLLTTPYCEFTDRNREHYWGWDMDGVKSLLQDAGWTGNAELFTPDSTDYYTFQVWVCR
jgi:hypothetical protein